MAWPNEGDYFSAIQNPCLCFSDPELKAGSATTNALGLPKPITGAFASVYQLNCPTRRTWAVRCFLRDIPDQQNRYAAISSHLKAVTLPYTVGFDYLRDGIRLSNKWYPILKMEWLDGVPMNTYVEQHLSQPPAIQELAKQWIAMIAALKRAQIAHGDLQHGNVLVCGSSLRLIDYDGMYVPALKGMHSNEVGQPNYQHPKRSGSDFNPELDNFSAWVIYISLLAFALEPSLWSSLKCGDENLLFRRDDFEHPTGSRVFRALDSSGSQQLKSLADQLRSLLYLPLPQIPSLDGVTVATPARKSLTGVPEWLADHVAEEKLDSLLADPPQTVTVAAADWIFDQLIEQKPLAPILHPGNVGLERFVILLALGLTVLVVVLLYGVTHSSSPPAAAAGINLALLAGFVVIRYRALGLVSDRSKLIGLVAQSRKALSTLEATVESIRAERQRTMQPLQELDLQYRTVPHRLQEAIRAVQGQFDDDLTRIENRRHSLVQQEVTELGNADAQAKQEMSALVGQRAELERAEQQEISNVIQWLRQNYVENFLRSHFLRDAEIRGIGPKLKERLSSYGISTGADVNWRLDSVPGIGAAKAAEIRAWRLKIEWQANQTAPSSIHATDQQRIRMKYASQRHSVDYAISSSAELQAKRRDRVAADFVRYRTQLDREERALREMAEKRVERTRSDFRVEKDQLSKEFHGQKSRTDMVRRHLDAQSASLSQDAFKQRTELHQLTREMSRYAEISFLRYLSLILGIRRIVGAWGVGHRGGRRGRG